MLLFFKISTEFFFQKMIWGLIQDDIYVWMCGHKLVGANEMTELV